AGDPVLVAVETARIGAVVDLHHAAGLLEDAVGMRAGRGDHEGPAGALFVADPATDILDLSAAQPDLAASLPAARDRGGPRRAGSERESQKNCQDRPHLSPMACHVEGWM